MASTLKGELRVLEQVIQRSDYIFIKMKPMTENQSCIFIQSLIILFGGFFLEIQSHSSLMQRQNLVGS